LQAAVVVIAVPANIAVQVDGGATVRA